MTEKKFTIVRNPNAPKRLIGYARVSTAEQSLNLQTDALKRAGVLADDIYVEHISGVKRKRPKLEEALASLRPGDTFVVWKLDRVARNLADLLRRMQFIADAGAGFKSLTESIDTTTPIGRLILHLLGSLAEFERDLIVERTRAGNKAAMARGSRYGQPAKLTPQETKEAQKMRNKGVSARLIAKKFKVSVPTVYNWTVGLSRTRKKTKRK